MMNKIIKSLTVVVAAGSIALNAARASEPFDVGVCTHFSQGKGIV